MGNLNKKAVVFTFVTVVLLSILIIAFLININNRTTLDKIQTINVKIETLNSFVRSLETTYIPNALRVSSNQVMLSLLDYEEKNHVYVPSLNDYFNQVLVTGYYNSVKQDKMFENSLDYTLTSTLNEITILASQQGITFDSLTFNIATLQINHIDPWLVNIDLDFSYSLKDTGEQAKWSINNKNILAILKVTNYNDPIYLVQNNPSIKLEITNITYSLGYFQDLGNFKSHVENVNFTNNPSAPNFLNRVEGKLGVASAYGIETLLDPFYYANPSGYSNADYQFYSQVLGLCVQNMPSNFKLDQSHIDYYGRTIC